MFRKFLLGTVAVSLLASPLAIVPASAQPQREARNGDGRRDDRGVETRRPAGPQYRTWRSGQRFDRRYAPQYREINYRSYRGLRQPPRGYHWVRSGNDAVLVAVTTGVIASVIAGAIR
ncbi:RcnB family protein [uncultured Sphingomonas sp.]|uniref:RcnB family protein n=1 Tax=uncultured Sphingomonas sp. TaxID=158754 RepID=UPI0035CC3F4A